MGGCRRTREISCSQELGAVLPPAPAPTSRRARLSALSPSLWTPPPGSRSQPWLLPRHGHARCCPSFGLFPADLASGFLPPVSLPAHPFLAPALPLPPRESLSLSGSCHLEPVSVPLSPRQAASQLVPSHRCLHVWPFIRPSPLWPELTMPSGCGCLNLVCLLCILGATSQPARGERAPGIGSRLSTAVLAGTLTSAGWRRHCSRPIPSGW